MHRLIVGLGNPGSAYAKTRHNLGFLAVQALAKKRGVSFENERSLKGALARCEESLFLLLPTTYMNLSGESVKRAIEKFHIPWKQEESALLIVVDDVYVPFGKWRYRKSGSAGGHNGLKSIEEHLQTREYPRFRLGIGPEEGKVDYPLEEFVLERFSEKEWEAMPTFLSNIVDWLEGWVEKK